VSTIPRFVVVLDQAGCRLPPVDVARAAIEGGADVIQIREKTLPLDAIRRAVSAIVQAIGPERVAINGHPDLALEYGTHLHLPEADPWPAVCPEGRLVSRSIHIGTVSVDPDLDYLVLGNILGTGSKPGLAGIGFPAIRSAVERFGKPVIAIGGMQPGSITPAIAAGAHGVAVRSSVIGAENPAAAARAIRKEIDAMTEHATQSTVTVQLNGKPREFAGPLTLTGVLEQLGTIAKMVVIEHNGTVIPRSEYPQTPVHDGDVLEIVHFVGGG
jgi:thiamine-phosphate pyrophosphorylase